LISHFRRDQSGAVAVEFVLIAPILLTLLFGIITVGYFMGLSHSVSQLAAGAARSSVAEFDAQGRTQAATEYLQKASVNYPLLVQKGVGYDLTFEGTDAQAITVSVSYAIDGSFLDIANGFLGLGITTIDGSAYLAY
jgi:Flp pilus assembly protein TadG